MGVSTSLPICLDLRGRRCVVIGDGPAATQKIRTLLECGAEVVAITTADDVEVQSVASPASLAVERRLYRDGDLDGCWLAFLASNDDALRARVVAEADRRRVWLNAVDEPASCSFIMPALHRRGRISIAVSTGGASPVLASRLRDEIAARIGEEYEVAADRLAGLRRRLAPGPKRQAAFARILDSGFVEALRSGDEVLAREIVGAALAPLGATGPDLDEVP